MLTLVNGPFFGVSDFLLPLIGVVATFTILFGNLAACAQKNIKRMLGLSRVIMRAIFLVAVMASMHFAGEAVIEPYGLCISICSSIYLRHSHLCRDESRSC